MGDVATIKPLTKSQQLRKVRKPMIERKRRERINGCLNELKSLVLESLNKDEAQYSKLEKADILELALEVLKKRGEQKSPVTPAQDPAIVAGKYTAGFSQCALEVTRCLGTIEGVQPEVRLHLTEHLASCVKKIARAANSFINNDVKTGDTVEKDNGAMLETVLMSPQSQHSGVNSPSQEQFTAVQRPNDLIVAEKMSQQLSPPHSHQYSSHLTPPASPNHVIAVTSPVYHAQPLHLLGHVVTSSAAPQLQQQTAHLVTSQQQTQPIRVLHNFTQCASPMLQQQLKSNAVYYGHVMATTTTTTANATTNTHHHEFQQHQQQHQNGHDVLKPQPLSATVYQAAQAAQSNRSMWRPW